jgi:hypothetical protein
MATLIRKSPPVCLGISIMRLMVGRLRLSKTYTGQTIEAEDGQEYTVFRHIRIYPDQEVVSPVTFFVRFKFSRLSHKANKIASVIPMLLITGYPGFHMKMYGVNRVNGYWQGMYQWESKQALDEYKESFVFRMMNKRAITSSISSFELYNQPLLSYFEKHKH